jgi:hypothetical protein
LNPTPARVLVLTGSGEFFSASTDIAELEERVPEAVAQKDLPALVLAKLAAKMAGRTDLGTGLDVEGLLANVLEATPERRERLRESLAG